MRSIVFALVCGWLFATVPALSAKSPLEKLEGVWGATADDGIKLHFSNSGPDWKVRAWGKCAPQDCDWGKMPLWLIAPSVDSTQYTHAFAVWNHGFATAYAAFTFEDDRLRVQIYTVFHDDSGRSNFRSTRRLQKAPR